MSAILVPSFDQAVVVRLTLPGEVRDEGLHAVREIAAQLPDPRGLPTGTLVAVAERLEGVPKATMLQRMTGRSPSARLHRAARCTALLARGYVSVGGGIGLDRADWAWGYAP